jgi:AcrR family transcriptional regulator
VVPEPRSIRPDPHAPRTAAGRYGAAREQAILDAVVELLSEVGYEALTIDAVAARAHASKTTIYGRWPGKAALVRAAVSEVVQRSARAMGDTAGLRDDLLAAMREVRSYLTPEFAAMMRGLVHAMSADRELSELLRPVLDDEIASREIIERAVRRGEISRGSQRRAAALVHEVIEGQIVRRMFVTGEPIDDRFARHVIDDMLMPLLSQATERAPQADESETDRRQRP